MTIMEKIRRLLTEQIQKIESTHKQDNSTEDIKLRKMAMKIIHVEEW